MVFANWCLITWHNLAKTRARHHLSTSTCELFSAALELIS